MIARILQSGQEKFLRSAHGVSCRFAAFTAELFAVTIVFAVTIQEVERVMGHSVRYQAIPTQSTLYARLQEDQAFVILLSYLFPYGCGSFLFFKDDPHGENEDILQDASEMYHDILGPEPEARRRIAECRAELERTCAAFPGVENRAASLENCAQEVRERLTRELALTRGGAGQFADKLLFGDGILAPHLDMGLPDWDQLRLVSVPIVQEGAAVLRRIDPVALFPEDWHRENYDDWRRLYLEAEGKSEVIVVGFA